MIRRAERVRAISDPYRAEGLHSAIIYTSTIGAATDQPKPSKKNLSTAPTCCQRVLTVTFPLVKFLIAKSTPPKFRANELLPTATVVFLKVNLLQSFQHNQKLRSHVHDSFLSKTPGWNVVLYLIGCKNKWTCHIYKTSILHSRPCGPLRMTQESSHVAGLQCSGRCLFHQHG